jgi:hypothetical protein
VDEIVMKLAKKNGRAVLKLETLGTTTVGPRVKVTHDVLVDILKSHEIARLIEPLCPEPDQKFSVSGGTFANHTGDYSEEHLHHYTSFPNNMSGSQCDEH